MTKSSELSRTSSAEKASLKQLREIQRNIDSPDPSKMYESVSELVSHLANLCLLPKAMDLLNHNDRNVQHACFTVVARRAFGQYAVDLFQAMKNLNPAEREQILQSIQERFSRHGGPSSKAEQKLWVEQLEVLGKEHQPAVFVLMRSLGDTGRRWLTKQIRDSTKSISFGAVPAIAGFPHKQRQKLVKLLSEKASKQKRELLPYICGVVDSRTYTYLGAFMNRSSWQERAEIAGAIARIGITNTSALVMQLVGDENWQVKQALLENLNISGSKLTSLLRVLGYLVAETHSRVRSMAQRTLLLLGLEKCKSSELEDQRRRLEKRFRPQLLKAAGKNKDLDVRWLGIEKGQADPMSEILEKVSSLEEEGTSDAGMTPEGVSLSDLAEPRESREETSTPSDDKSALLTALLGAKASATSETPKVDPVQPASKRFIRMLQSLSREGEEGVPIEQLLKHAPEYGFSHEEMLVTMAELEKRGLVYRSGKAEDRVSYADQRSKD